LAVWRLTGTEERQPARQDRARDHRQQELEHPVGEDTQLGNVELHPEQIEEECRFDADRLKS
jgi:hypothetical protein